MTSKNYIKGFLPIMVGVLTLHVLLVGAGLLPVSLRMTLISDVIVLFIFSASAPLVIRGLNKDNSSFVGSFLIITTIQMLSTMSVLGAFVYSKIPGFRFTALQMVIIFVIILAIQSYFLIKIVNNPNRIPKS